MRAFVTFLLLAVASSTVFGQSDYVPIAPANPLIPNTILKNTDIVASSLGDHETIAADVTTRSTSSSSAVVLPTCSPEPALAEIKGALEYHQTLLSTAAAAKLGLPFGSVSGSGNDMVLVRDWSRSVDCAATDGKTVVTYGQAIRTVIRIATYDAKADLSLAAVAANATINHKSSQVSIQALGFQNPKINDAVASIASKELTVETYGDFTKVESTLIGLADAADTVQSVRRLGIVTDVSDNALRDSVASAWALQQMSEGKTCDQARTDFPMPADPSVAAIEAVYKQVTGVCAATAPNQTQKLRAQQLLLGLKVKK